MTQIKKTGIFLLGFIIILSLGVLLWRSVEDSSSETKGTVGQTEDFAEAQHLAGQWVRPDGGYRLVIEDVKPDGSLNVSYFNPNRINVSISNWKFEDNRIHVFVELRDVNYPGSKYNLVYISERDVLIGAYFQAVHKQTFNVSFKRMTDQ